MEDGGVLEEHTASCQLSMFGITHGFCLHRPLLSQQSVLRNHPPQANLAGDRMPSAHGQD